ncbi:hypothetical protein GW916_08070 [bacterium]|nr:hypothetical protein [bacterium]
MTKSIGIIFIGKKTLIQKTSCEVKASISKIFKDLVDKTLGFFYFDDSFKDNESARGAAW